MANPGSWETVSFVRWRNARAARWSRWTSRFPKGLDLHMAVNCDILIVGGGVMGASIAWRLAQRRVGRVVLLEKSFLGAGSSGKSGAIIRQHYSNRLTAAMAQQTLRP